LNIVERF